MGIAASKAEPTLTEKNLPDQQGKVFIVTGSTSGVGSELANVLYAHNAKVYIAARSAEKGQATIQSIKSKNPESKGEASFLKLDLGDLTTIKPAADEFLSREHRLDVLWNNAGVMVPPQGSLTKQKYEMQLGTNNVAPTLFTKLLTPILTETAKTAPASSVRVVWVASSAAERFSPKGGVEMDNLDYKQDKGAWHKYGVSKAGNILQGMAYAKDVANDGVVSVSLDPGNLKTDLWVNLPVWQKYLVDMVLKDPIFGAYTELFAGLSPKISMSNTGSFIEPWGQLSSPRKDILASGKSKEEGGTGVGDEFWAWLEKEVSSYL